MKRRKVSIVSIQTDQSRLFTWCLPIRRGLRFNRINSGRSIPTGKYFVKIKLNKEVSIVSIQADQSRLLLPQSLTIFPVRSFNRINSGRSIPTRSITMNFNELIKSFQSYQFRQINPDEGNINLLHKLQDESFNRINSGRSIPTKAWYNHLIYEEICFNRINSGRSIPTS